MSMIEAFCESCYQTVQVDPAKVGKYMVDGTEYVGGTLVPPDIPYTLCWHITVCAGHESTTYMKKDQ